MTIRVGWGDESKSYIYFQLVYNWRAEELIGAIREERRLAATVPHEPDILVNVSDGSEMQPRLLVQLKRIPAELLTLNREVVIVGTSPYDMVLMKHIIFVVIPKLSSRVRYLDSVEDAQSYLRHKRTTRAAAKTTTSLSVAAAAASG